MSFECEFCTKTLKSKKTLTAHQENAKYCLKLRGAEPKNIFACDLCNKHFVLDHHLKTHLKTCKQIKTDDYEQKYILQQKDLADTKKLLKECNKIITERDKEIVTLKEALAFEKGKIDVYQNSKPSTIVNTTNKNCAINSKLSHIQITTIKPFTLEGVAELLPQYTEDRFRNKLTGLVSLVIPFTSLNVNGVTERNIVCTDLARTKCHVLNVDREWERDDGLTICSDIIKVFIPKMKEYMSVYDEKFEEANKHVNAESHSITKSSAYASHRKDFDYYFELIEDIRLGFYAPATRGTGDEYDTLVRKFRDSLKPAIYVESVKAIK